MPNKLTTFVVEGQYPFPVDMLRYDACYPATSEDAVQLAESMNFIRRNVLATQDLEKRTRTVKLTTQLQNRPTTGRWESFGWKVIV